jgi:hypothetical protein
MFVKNDKKNCRKKEIGEEREISGKGKGMVDCGRTREKFIMRRGFRF